MKKGPGTHSGGLSTAQYYAWSYVPWEEAVLWFGGAAALLFGAVFGAARLRRGDPTPRQNPRRNGREKG